MILVQLDAITKYYSDEPVLQGVSLEIRAGQRLGLIGPNGCGKTTLLNILAGVIEPDLGSVTRSKQLRCGYLKQSFDGDESQTVWEFARSALGDRVSWSERLETLAHEIAACQNGDDRHRLAKEFDSLQERLHQVGGFQFDYQIERVLSGLGFDKSAVQQSIGSLSGGQVNRLMLAHLLLAEPDLMLLDEPSNHLDMRPRNGWSNSSGKPDKPLSWSVTTGTYWTAWWNKRSNSSEAIPTSIRETIRSI